MLGPDECGLLADTRAVALRHADDTRLEIDELQPGTTLSGLGGTRPPLPGARHELALISTEAVRELRLEPGVLATARVKATSVIVEAAR